MRFESENPYDVAVDSSAQETVEKQSTVRVRQFGSVKILKPLVTPEMEAASRCRNAKRTDGKYSRAHRGLSIVGGLIALLAFFISGGMFIGIQDPVAETLSASTGSQSKRLSPGPKAPGTWVTLPSRVPPRLPAGPVLDYKVVNAIARTPRTLRTFYRAPLVARRVHFTKSPRLVNTKFVPTTLIIYAENGVIKSRIEPQLTAVFKKPSLFRN